MARLVVVRWAFLILGGVAPRATAQIVEIQRPMALPPAGGKAAPIRVESLKESKRLCALDRSVSTLERALIDVFDAGQAAASIQLVRLCLGEPHIFTVPLYLVVGGDAAAAGDAKPEDRSLASLVAPTGGAINLQVTNVNKLFAGGKYTELSLSYQVGARFNRLAKSADPNHSEPVLSGDFQGGLRFQTGAWDLDDPKAEAGVLWVQGQFGVHLASSERLGVVFGQSATNPTSLSLEGGIEIKDRIGLRASWYKVLNNAGLPDLHAGVAKIGFEFKVRSLTPAPAASPGGA